MTLRRNEGMPVGGIHVRRGDHDEDHDGGELDEHHRRVEPGRFAHADGQQHRQQQHDDHGRHIDDAAVERCVGQRVRQMQAEEFEDLAEISGPADGDGGGGDGVFQDQVPADDPRDQFADAGIGIAVGAARAADGARELGIGERGEGAGDAGNDERQHDGGAGMLRRDHAGEHENARADDAADAEHGQVEGAKAAFQAGIGIHVNRLCAEQTHAFSLVIIVACVKPEVCLLLGPQGSRGERPERFEQCLVHLRIAGNDVGAERVFGPAGVPTRPPAS